MSSFVRTFKARKAFLDQLAVGDSVSRAAAVAGGTAGNFRRWREADENFAKDWDEAIEEGTDTIEDVATARAIDKSDPLMAMILRARRPEKYDRGSKLELSGTVNVEGSKTKLLNRIARLQAAARSATEEEREAAAQAEIEEGKEGKGTPQLSAPQNADLNVRPKRRRAHQRG